MEERFQLFHTRDINICCCLFNVQKAAKIIAIVDIILVLYMLVHTFYRENIDFTRGLFFFGWDIVSSIFYLLFVAMPSGVCALLALINSN
jgi:hypothetical protein